MEMSRFDSTIATIKKAAANRSLARLVKKVSWPVMEPFLHGLDDRALDQARRYLAQGADIHLAKGAVDGLFRAPDLMMLLMDHGATPSNGFVDGMEKWLGSPSGKMRMMAFPSYKPGDRLDTEYAMFGAMMHRCVKDCPGLEWYRWKGGNSNSVCGLLPCFGLSFGGLEEKLVNARSRENIPLGPLEGTSEQFTALLCDCLTIHPQTPWVRFARDHRHAKFLALAKSCIERGASMDVRLNPSIMKEFDQTPLLALAYRISPEVARFMVEKGARIDQDVLNGMAHCLSERGVFSDRMWPDRFFDAFSHALDNFDGDVMWEAKVKCSDLFAPSLSLVAEHVCPGFFDRLDVYHAKRQAIKMQGDTPAAAPATPGRCRRI